MLRLVFLLILSPTLLAGRQTPSLPAPTGTRLIGRSCFAADGEAVILWYPAQQRGNLAAYASKTLLASIAKSGYYDQSANTIQSWANVKTHAYENAKAIPDRAPLLIFLPGAGVYGFQYTAFAEEFASRGYVVALVDYFSSQAPKRSYGDEDFAAMENDMAKAAVATLKALSASSQWSDRVRLDRVGIVGHSIGGAAAIAAARLDRRFVASGDLDGAPFGESIRGAVAPVQVLRSKPIYSDADLSKHGRSREQWDKMGQEARKTWTEFEAKSGATKVEIWSVQGTGHFSFSDAPFVMPDAITRFGGNTTTAERGHQVITTCLVEFFDGYVGQGAGPKSAPKRCSTFAEIVPGIPVELSHP